jgi:hypothetical protein
MPRRLRIEHPGAIDPVMNRGEQREAVFHDDIDRKRFVTALSEAYVQTGWQVHVHCMMNSRVATLKVEPGEQNEFNLE